MNEYDYPKASKLKEGHEVISKGIRRTITFKIRVEGLLGLGMGYGPDYIYIVLDNGEVWTFGEWAEVSRGRLVSTHRLKSKPPTF